MPQLTQMVRGRAEIEPKQVSAMPDLSYIHPPSPRGPRAGVSSDWSYQAGIQPAPSGREGDSAEAGPAGVQPGCRVTLGVAT